MYPARRTLAAPILPPQTVAGVFGEPIVGQWHVSFTFTYAGRIPAGSVLEIWVSDADGSIWGTETLEASPALTPGGNVSFDRAPGVESRYRIRCRAKAGDLAGSFSSALDTNRDLSLP